MSILVMAQDVKKYYGKVAAVKGISFSIHAGECYGFLGHNGAGKSTTMRMLYGLSRVDGGKLTLFEQSVELTPPEWKARMGIVPQEDNLDTDVTALENLELYGGFFGISRKESRRRGEELMAFMGLEDKMNAMVETLSGGNKRRLVIARALINRPELVILDEPTTGLDPQARRLVWQKLRQLKEDGVTLILTTHYMEEAAQLCDRLAIMNEGIILAEGSPHELVEQYVLPYAIEIRLPEDRLPDRFRDKVIEAENTLEILPEGVFLYTREGRRAWDQLIEWGIPSEACYLRTSHLEDVFLKLTGRSCEGDDAWRATCS